MVYLVAASIAVLGMWGTRAMVHAQTTAILVTPARNMVVANGTTILGARTLQPGGCVIVSVAAPNATQSMRGFAGSNQDIQTIVGFQPGAARATIGNAYITAGGGGLNWSVCNSNPDAINIGAITFWYSVEAQ